MDSPTGEERPSREVHMAVEYCLEEALLDVQEAIARQGRRWQDIPGLKTSRDAFDDRTTARYTRKPERVPFDRLLKNHLSRELPDFAFRPHDLKEELHFAKALTPSTDLLLIVRKIHKQGLGKTFELHVGAHFNGTRLNRPIWERPASWVYSSWGSLQWTYSSADDLNTALGSLIQITREIVPPLEQAFRQWLGQMPMVIPANQPARVGLTAREALELAQGTACAWQDDAFLVSLQGWHTISHGRLTERDSWRFDFASHRAFDRFLCVRVPATGRVKWGSYHNAWDAYQRVIFSPLVDWMDSPAAWAAAQQTAEAQVGPGNVVEGRIDMAPIPDTGRPKHQWRLNYPQSGKTYAAHLILSAFDLTLHELRPPY